MYCLALLPALLAAGRVLDRRGPRVLVWSGLLLAAAGSLLFAAASGTGWLYAARAVQGVAVGIATGALTAGVVANAPPGDADGAARTAVIVLCGGAGLGPVVASAVTTWLPAPQMSCYLLAAALLVAVTPAALFAVAWVPASEGSQPAAAAADRMARVYAGSVRHASAVSAAAWAVAAVFLALIPSFTAQLLGTANLLTAAAAAGLLLLPAAAVQPLARYLPPTR